MKNKINPNCPGTHILQSDIENIERDQKENADFRVALTDMLNAWESLSCYYRGGMVEKCHGQIKHLDRLAKRLRERFGVRE